MVRITTLPNDLHTIMCDGGRGDASIEPKEECANGREHGEAKRVQRLTHIGGEKIEVLLSLKDKSTKSI